MSGTEPVTSVSSPSLPDAARIEALAGFGLSVDEIARIYRLEADEIRRAFTHELEAGEAKANVRVAENLYRKATGDGREAVTAAIFWLKTRARWKESHRGVGDEGPLVIQIQHFAQDL